MELQPSEFTQPTYQVTSKRVDLQHSLRNGLGLGGTYAIGPGFGSFPFQGDDHIMPIGIGGGQDIGGTGICLGVCMAMHHPDNFQSPFLGRSFSAEMIFGIDGVNPR